MTVTRLPPSRRQSRQSTSFSGDLSNRNRKHNHNHNHSCKLKRPKETYALTPRNRRSDFNFFNHTNTAAPSTPPIMTDNEVLADPLEDIMVSPSTKASFDHQRIRPPQGGMQGMVPTIQHHDSYGTLNDKERKHSRAPFQRLRHVLSGTHLKSRDSNNSRRNSPEMTNYDSHSLSSTLHPADYRRPSLASQTTQSSTGSRRSHTEASSTDSPMHGSTSLPQSLDPSELSLITNMPAASAAALDSSIYATNNNLNTNNNNNFQPVSYPDPVCVAFFLSGY